MIGVKLEGRLGNQLFQYAFAYAAAKKLNTKFYLDRSVIPFLLPQYFNVKRSFIERLFSIKGFRSFFNLHLRIKFYRVFNQYFNLNRIRFDEDAHPNTQLALLKNSAFYIGFFQSELYFEELKDDLLSIFQVKKKHKQAFEKVFTEGEIPENYAVIHVRKGDYVERKWVLDYAYYHKALKDISTGIDFFVFISDEPDLISSVFDYLPNKYISRNNEIIDFQFLLNAKACILSNSSFSWWGAYLNINNPFIIAPKYWLGFAEKVERPCNVISKKFTVVEIE